MVMIPLKPARLTFKMVLAKIAIVATRPVDNVILADLMPLVVAFLSKERVIVTNL